jgi:hydroxyacylglutathione hydrolase
MPELTPKDAFRLQEEGRATLVDLRAPAEFAQGHPRGAINVPFSERSLAPRIALCLAPGGTVVMLDEDQSRLGRAVQQLEEAGGPALAGVVRGGWAEWRRAGLPSQQMEEAPVHDLARRLAEKDRPILLDVREPIEWEMGHIPGATLISLRDLRDRLDEFDRDRPILVVCESGIRSSTGASILKTAGFGRVANIPEGTAGYRSGGLPLEYPES